MAEKLEVTKEGTFYAVGAWTFEDEDKDLAHIDEAIAAWTSWREYVAREQGFIE